jgi:hypothetical protein
MKKRTGDEEERRKEIECREAIRELLDEHSPEFAEALAIRRPFRRSYRRR